jgi:ABC-type amino acid transport substrate-binding protein
MMRWLKYAILFPSSMGIARPISISAPDWPPFFIHDAPNEANLGMGWDILKRCTTQLTLPATFETYPISRMFKYMEGGQLDLNVMSFKPERTKILDYGREMIFENNYNIWIRANLTNKIQRLADLESLNLAFLTGSKTTAEAQSMLEHRKGNNSIETIYVNEQEQIIRMLAAGHSDATISSSPEFRWRLKQLKLEHKLLDTGISIQSQAYFVVASKNSDVYRQNPNLLNQIDQCVKNLKSTGVWAQLKKRYEL